MSQATLAAARTQGFSSPGLTSSALLFAVVFFVAGCETIAPGRSSQGGATANPPAARYNLTGYPASFKQGYADACATPRRRDDTRIKSDDQYSMGWRDGQSACRTR